MKKIFEQLTLKGYEVYNKRILGNPSYTSEETRNRDITQEIALVVEWLRVNHGEFVSTEIYLGKYRYVIYKVNNPHSCRTPWRDNKLFNSPQEAYLEAFDYIFKNLL